MVIFGIFKFTDCEKLVFIDEMEDLESVFSVNELKSEFRNRMILKKLIF